MGDTGVGKSVVMEKYLENASNTDEFVAYTMKYSAQTKPTNLKDMFETKLEKKRKTLFGPPSGKKMLFFIDDLNMPALEVCCCCCCRCCCHDCCNFTTVLPYIAAQPKDESDLTQGRRSKQRLMKRAKRLRVSHNVNNSHVLRETMSFRECVC